MEHVSLVEKNVFFSDRPILCGRERISAFEKRDKESFFLRYRTCAVLENVPYKI